MEFCVPRLVSQSRHLVNTYLEEDAAPIDVYLAARPADGVVPGKSRYEIVVKLNAELLLGDLR